MGLAGQPTAGRLRRSIQPSPRLPDNCSVTTMPAPPVNPPLLPPPAVAVQPLTPEHLRVLQVAQAEARPIRRAVSVARFDGWTIALFGGLTALLGLPAVSNVLIGLALVAIGAIELRAANRLRRLDPRSLRT